MAAPVITPLLQWCDANGVPMAGGSIATYQPGTSTPKPVYVDPDLTAAATNPVVMDAAGRTLMYGDGEYRLVIRDALGNLVADIEATTIVSAAMAPVVAAPTIADAINMLGIDDLIAAEASARAAGDSAEQTARIAADNALGARIDAEEAARIAGDAAIQAQIDALPELPEGITGVQGGAATTDGGGFYHLVFPTPFANAVDAVCITPVSDLFVSDTPCVDAVDRFSCNVRLTQGGSATPVVSGAFTWIAVGH